MKLAVKFWSEAESNPMGVPEIWPMTVLQVKDDCAGVSGYVLMTMDQFQDYLALNQAQYDEWYSTYQSVV